MKLLSSFYMCYLFILFHELSHVFVGSIFGKKINELKLSISGVSVSFCKEKFSTKVEKGKFCALKNILIYFAGPFSNLVLATIFHKINMIFEINIFLGIINLMPIYPLDGYHILDNILIVIKNISIKRAILSIIENCTFGFMLVASVYEIVMYKNISILIFAFYVYLQKNQRYDITRFLKD